MTGLRFWGFYENFDGMVADNFTVRIYGDAAGLPAGMPLQTIIAGEADLKIAASSPANDPAFEYEIHFGAPIAFGGGQFWISIQNDTSNTDADTTWR